MTARILTLSGASGSGKTTIAKELLREKEFPRHFFRLVESFTTRKPRKTDLPEEYVYIDDQAFETMNRRSAFLWTTKVRESSYGTLRNSIDNAALSGYKTSLLLLVPETVKILYDHIRDKKCMLSLFVETNPELVRKRLANEDREAVAARLNDQRDWKRQMLETGVPFKTISNNGNLQETIFKIEEALEE